MSNPTAEALASATGKNGFAQMFADAEKTVGYWKEMHALSEERNKELEAALKGLLSLTEHLTFDEPESLAEVQTARAVLAKAEELHTPETEGSRLAREGRLACNSMSDAQRDEYAAKVDELIKKAADEMAAKAEERT